MQDRQQPGLAQRVGCQKQTAPSAANNMRMHMDGQLESGMPPLANDYWRQTESNHRLTLQIGNFRSLVKLYWYVPWTGFWLTGPISLCIDSFVFMCLKIHAAYMSYYCNAVGGPGRIKNLIFSSLSSFSALTLLVGSIIRPVKTSPRYDL